MSDINKIIMSAFNKATPRIIHLGTPETEMKDSVFVELLYTAISKHMRVKKVKVLAHRLGNTLGEFHKSTNLSYRKNVVSVLRDSLVTTPGAWGWYASFVSVDRISHMLEVSKNACPSTPGEKEAK